MTSLVFFSLTSVRAETWTDALSMKRSIYLLGSVLAPPCRNTRDAPQTEVPPSKPSTGFDNVRAEPFILAPLSVLRLADKCRLQLIPCPRCGEEQSEAILVKFVLPIGRLTLTAFLLSDDVRHRSKVTRILK